MKKLTSFILFFTLITISSIASAKLCGTKTKCPSNCWRYGLGCKYDYAAKAMCCTYARHNDKSFKKILDNTKLTYATFEKELLSISI